MKKLNLYILVFLWTVLLSTFCYALANNYLLFLSDKLGFLGLSLATLIIVRKPKISPEVLLCLLLPGVLNILSFIYFFNPIFSFGISILVTPGLQLLSIVLLVILLTGNRGLLSKSLQFILATSKEDLTSQSTATENIFLQKFEKFSNEELEKRLTDDLTPEAKSAIVQILKSRQSNS